MPYGLFDYGGTINTMGVSPGIYDGGTRHTSGESPAIDWKTGLPIDRAQVTWANPEENPSQQITTMMVGEEGNPYTLRMPEEGPINPPSGGTGGCPAGYAPAQTGGFDPVAPGSPGLGFHEGGGYGVDNANSSPYRFYGEADIPWIQAGIHQLHGLK